VRPSVTERRKARLRCALAALAFGCAFESAAQVSGSVGVVSDYRYRGYSLSDGDPALQASIGYDWAKGAYAGVFASTADYGGDGGVQLVPYLGYARRDAQGRSWDVGVRGSHFTANDEADYIEFHAGVAWRRVALRLHYSPDYFGQVSNTYLELDGSVPIGERWRWLWHVGAAHSGESSSGFYDPMPDPGGPGGPGDPYDAAHARPSRATYYEGARNDDRTRLDVRTGVSLATRVCDVQLTWQTIDGDDAAAYVTPWNPRDRSGWVLGCVHRW
jgi:uncharacterized protein (TIGR02001 family)